MRLILLTIWMACGFAASVLAGPAYEADFDGEVDQVWSRKTVETTPSGKVKFLGRFSNDVVRLTLDDLADHHFVRLRFDLLIIGRWSGDRQVSGANKIIGPDQWGLDVESRVLIHTTFSNAYFRKGWTQAWPGEFGQFKAEPGSGAAAVGALGYTWKYSDVGVKRADSRYRIEVVFPHTSTELLLSFYGICLAGKQSESWGLDNVSVELLQASPYAGDLSAHLKALMGKDPSASRRAREESGLDWRGPQPSQGPT